MANSLNISDIRKNYALRDLTEDKVSKDPLEQFISWLNEAITAQVDEPTAMVLSTVNASGFPSARVVLLKGIENGQFVFYTNYNSRKGSEIAETGKVALTFFWPVLERQVRIEGLVQKVTSEQSDSYFNSRPRGSQIGAWVSPQSQKIANREELENLTQQYISDLGTENNPIPRPPHWGGYGVIPNYLEFWQGRPNRLHDRLLYEWDNESPNWVLSRLAP